MIIVMIHLFKRVIYLKKIYKILISLVIVIIVSLISYLFDEPWLLVLYNILLALFPNEIKVFFKRLPQIRRVRISYSYIFRIDISGYYLLVKDEQGRNNYHPVGGVYKYDSQNIDIDELFNGISDGLFNAREDIKDDLRLIIDRNKLKKFNSWFASRKGRENIENLSREFKEELLDRNIVSKDVFSSIKYSYIGSYIEKSYNDELKMRQIRHFDIFKIKLTNAQKTHLEKLMTRNSEQYLFASSKVIEEGVAHSGGNHYEIAEYSKLITSASKKRLRGEFVDFDEYSVNIKSEESFEITAEHKG